MDLSLWLAFLQAVLGVVSNTTLSQSKKDTALGYVGLLGALVKAGQDVNQAMTLMTERLKSGDPITEQEWDQLKGRSDAAHATIQGSEQSASDSTQDS